MLTYCCACKLAILEAHQPTLERNKMNKDQTIAEMTKELEIRESAAKHLKGVQKSQNENTIHKLYDRLANAHIAMFEAM